MELKLADFGNRNRRDRVGMKYATNVARFQMHYKWEIGVSCMVARILLKMVLSISIRLFSWVCCLIQVGGMSNWCYVLHGVVSGAGEIGVEVGVAGRSFFFFVPVLQQIGKKSVDATDKTAGGGWGVPGNHITFILKQSTMKSAR